MNLKTSLDLQNRKRTYCKAIALALLTAPSLLAPSLTSASEGGAQNTVPVMEEVVVSATKTEAKRKDIANSVIVMETEDIEESPAKGVGELLANEPGVDLRARGNYGGAAEEIHIRGMGAEGTQVLINGVVINSPSLGSANVAPISLNNIERIEVVKGPGSVLYGSGAMGGTVNIITKRPTRDGYVAKAEAGYGTESTYHLALESGGFLVGDFGYYLNANRKETDGFRDNSDLDHNDVGLNLLYDLGDPLEASFDFGYVDREYGVPGVQPPAGIAPYMISGVAFYNSDSASLLDRGGEENLQSSLQLKGKAIPWLDWRVKGDYAKLEGYNLSRGYNPLTFLYDGGGSETTVTNTVQGVEGNLDLHPFSRLGLLLGSEYRNFKYENNQQNLNTAGVPVATGKIDEKHRVFTHGTFAEANLQMLDEVRFSAGVRYEEHSLFGHETVARYALIVNPLPSTSIKISHGKHFKAPTMNDLFWPDDGMFTKGNPNLKPETGWHTDVTVEQGMLDDKLFATISYFKWNISDKITWAPDPTPGSFYWLPSNVDSYRATGWEAGLQIGPFYGILADVAVTLLDAEEVIGTNAPRRAHYSPNTQIKTGLSHYADFGLTSSLTARYVSSRTHYYTDFNTFQPAQLQLDSYWTVDLKLEQSFADHWTVTLLAANLLDEEYATYSSDFNDRTMIVNAYSQRPYPGAGRSGFLSVSYEF